jgi:HNH endonuclease
MTRREKRIAKGIPRTPMEFPVPQPTTPLSSNVVPITFDSYHEAAKGIGHPAVLRLFRTFGPFKIKPHRGSTGVIWRNRPYWWSEKGYYRIGKANVKRRPLQHLIWEHHYRKIMLPMHEIFFKDRDRHNFSPSNLELLSKAELHKRCIELGEVTQLSRAERGLIAGKRWHRQSRRLTGVLLNRFNIKESNADHHNTIHTLKRPALSHET